MDKPNPAAQALLDEVAELEKYAGQLMGFARDVRMCGHDDAADRLMRFSRHQRIIALEQLGRLAALVCESTDGL